MHNVLAILFTFAIVLIHIDSYSINTNNIKYDTVITTFTWYYFKTHDTIYHITKYEKPNSKFSFGIGFRDSTYVDPEILVYGAYEDKGIKQKPMFRFVPSSIDTIESYRSFTPVEYSDSAKSMHYRANEFFVWWDLIIDIRLSYMFDQLGVDKIDTSHNSISIRHSSIDYFRGNIYSILISELNILKDSNSAKVKRIKAKYSIESGYQILKKETGILKERDVQRIKNRFGEFKNASQKNCKGPGLYILYEIHDTNYKSSVFTFECLRAKRRDYRGFRRNMRFFNRVLSRSLR
ncbi:MAG: hypothetical protein EA412_00880 [Chitinophagaceae bacterium]|nr:MAG: hypothetical protein EA412_00880 [Chitinophagaceae bacterium]